MTDTALAMELKFSQGRQGPVDPTLLVLGGFCSSAMAAVKQVGECLINT